MGDVFESDFYFKDSFETTGGGSTPESLKTLADHIKNKTTVPMTINTLAILGSDLPTLSLDQIVSDGTNLFNYIFDSNGDLRIESYQLYILLLCLFGKVKYFEGSNKSNFFSNRSALVQR